MKMKTFLCSAIVSLFMLIPSVVSAQQLIQKQAQTNADRVAKRTSKREKIREELMQTRSQFRVGVGMMPFGYKYVGRGHNNITQYRTPLISLEYSYRVWNFLEAGLSTSYANYKWREYYTDNTLKEGFDSNAFNLNLTARYSWFNSRWVSLYSSIGVWWEFSFENTRKNDEAETYKFYNGLVLPEVTVIGVRVGRRLFGYFEPLGFSGRGILLQAGLGFKF